MARSRSASFSDDDLMIVSSQAASSQGALDGSFSQDLGGGLMSSPLHSIRPPNEIIDITSSPLARSGNDFGDRNILGGNGPISKGQAAAAGMTSGPASSSTSSSTGRSGATTRQPVFGRPTQMAPSATQRRQNTMFNPNRNRPEHHRPQRLTGPLAPKHADRKAAPRPMFSSQPSGDTSYPVSSYYSNKGGQGSQGSQDGYGQQKKIGATYNDVNFYTDPEKAAADLKALLEGGMEDDDDDDEEEQPQQPQQQPPTQEKGGSATNLTSKTSNTEEAPKTIKKPKKMIEGAEDGTIAGIKTKLLPHQVEGVQWMKGRELGPVKRGRVPKGGILADDMGLGKTLQSISLIVSNPKPANSNAPGWKKHFDRVDKSTLVVAPLALIRQWEAEIKEKVEADPGLRVCVHHGPQRTVRPRDLAQFDVVITTYQILVSEHGHSNDSLKSGCFGVNWYRVILDEAHSIKNRNAKTTKACCSLSAEYRWCLTGTPMQNNLDELQSLVNFLRITPYDSLAEWRNHIDAPMKNGRGYLAIRRLHSLLRCFMKRRTKDILKEEGALVPGGKKALDAAKAIAEDPETGKDGSRPSSSSAACTPPAPKFKITERNVVEVKAEFSPAEREFYDRLEARADKSLEKMMQAKGMNYANALVLLLRLRQACNHPSLLNVKLDKDKDAMATDTSSRQRGLSRASTPSTPATDGDIDDLADALGGLGIQTKKCEVCMSDLTREEQEAASQLGDELVCTACLEDRSLLDDIKPKKEKKEQKSKKGKKDRKDRKEKKGNESRDKNTKIKNDDGDDDDEPVAVGAKRRQRNRRLVLDSDDEDEDENDNLEEADGSWLVGEDQRGSLHLGKAGGEEDENAEGGGEWISRGDSDNDSEDDDDSDATRMSSFIVDDEPKNGKGGKDARLETKRAKAIVIGDEDDSDDDDFVSFAKSGSGSQSDSETDSESGSGTDSDASDSDDSSFIDEQKKTGVASSLIRRRKNVHKQRRAKERGNSFGDDEFDRDGNGLITSAKIRKMIAIVGAEADEHKFIVFSQFTSMLDVIEPFLKRQGLGFERYDGGMRNDAREAALNSLRTNPRTRVLLCSLKCGALGLNLTAATRVVILEPFWNPFVEEQAIDRVHRLTQTVDVTVYKLTVADTVEERILELQAKKRLLASQALEGGSSMLGGGKNGKNGKKEALKLGLQELMDLFRRGDGKERDPGEEGPGLGDAQGEQNPFIGTPKASGGLLRRRDTSKTTSSQDSVYSRRW